MLYNLKSHHSPESVEIPGGERVRFCRENTCDWWQLVWNQRHLDNDLLHRPMGLLMETSLLNLCDQIACEIMMRNGSGRKKKKHETFVAHHSLSQEVEIIFRVSSHNLTALCLIYLQHCMKLIISQHRN